MSKFLTCLLVRWRVAPKLFSYFMKCPHCKASIYSDPQLRYLDTDKDGSWAVHSDKCPTCERLILTLSKVTRDPNNPNMITATCSVQNVYPRTRQEPDLAAAGKTGSNYPFRL